MKRLTIKDEEKLTFANRVWNDCYADKDRNACIRSVDGTSQDLRSFIKEMWCKLIDKAQVFPEDDEEFDEWLEEYIQYETAEGLLAYLYQQMYSKADLQNTLKYFEDKVELEKINLEEELVEFIINYGTTLKTALVIKNRNLIEQCVEEWIEERIKE